MINPTETDERAYLEQIKQRLGDALDALDVRVRRYAREIQEQKEYVWESRAEMDRQEKVSARQAADQIAMSGEAVLAAKRRVQKLLLSPYFGRIDFTKSGVAAPLPVYIGVHAFLDETKGQNLVFDWRAPISTLFYDFELGRARYDSPSGRIEGNISLKRQFRIREGEMAFMLESGLSIMDDVLQEELSRASDDRMKTIVATIQRDQNAIIRNEDAAVLVIQGVAGSGKTSIALHRVAFLLYRYKESLSAKDILIISPNKVFGDFISDVLPELGEEPIAEKGMEELARELLEDKFAFQTFFEQTEKLLERDDPAMQRRIREKASCEFLEQLDAYAAHVEETRFKAADIWVAGRLLPAWIVEEAFTKRSGLPLAARLKWAAEVLEQEVWSEYRYELTARDRAELRARLKTMYRSTTLRTTYKELFDWLGKPELLKAAGGAGLEYADVFPLVYLKMRLEGIESRYKDIKHLVVDEMQDYTPVQYAVLERLFTCEKTILGDASQSVNPFSASTAETIGGVFRHAEKVKLCKSYRSSFEIARFAQTISKDADLVAIERHGEPPVVTAFNSRKKETDHLRELIDDFAKSGYRTMGIICKTQKAAARAHKALQGTEAGPHLLTPKSTTFEQGVVVCSVHLAKGLEFDEVVVPGVDASSYDTEMERHLLYVACTRAMHRLHLTHVGEPCRFIRNPV